MTVTVARGATATREANVGAQLESYRNRLPYPFCPGCGHGPILDHLDRALVTLGLPPERVVIVSDIGCSGLSDQYFVTSAFHGLHGRSLTYATGIRLARPELEVIVIMGDGGAGIGGAHLLNAARRNVGLTLLVLDNLNFGMTGGQHSVTTPTGAVTATTPGGCLEHPLDLCATAAVNGAAFVYRGTSFDDDLHHRIVEAVRTPGFALLDLWEPCTAHFAATNKLSRRGLFELIERLGLATGVIQKREVPDYGTAYRQAHAAELGRPALAPRPIEPRFDARLDRRRHLVLAGSAGGRVRSAAHLLAEAAVLSGAWAAARDDFPVTVRSGFSWSELTLAPEPIDDAGADRPDLLLLLSEDGRKRAARHLAAMPEDGRVFTVPPLAEVDTRARVTVLDPSKADRRVPRTQTTLFAAAATVAELGLLLPEALRDAARRGPAEQVEKNLEAIEAGLSLCLSSSPPTTPETNYGGDPASEARN